MEKTKKKVKGYEAILRGSICAIVIYLLGIFLVAFLAAKGVLPQERAFMMLAVAAVVAVFCGGFISVRVSAMGGLSAILTSCLVACVMVVIGLCFRQGISWTEQGGVLLLCVFVGGILAAWFGRKKRRSGKRVKK